MVGFERAAPQRQEPERPGAEPSGCEGGLLTIARPRLEVGAVDDPLEREADLVAQQVVAALAGERVDDHHPTGGEPPPGSPPAIRRVPAASRIRRSADVGRVADDPSGDGGGVLDTATTTRIERARRGGRPVPATVRRSMESALGADLSAVRLHTGRESTELNDRIRARAFTIGADVFFRDGMPDASRADGQELLAHELTHTLQQQPGSAAIGRIQRRGGKKKGRRARKRARNRRRRSRRGGGGRGRGPVVEAPTADSAFTKLTWLVDLAAPSNGDSGSLEASVKIPVGPASFVQFDLEAEVERGDDDVEIGAEIAVGYGGELPYGFSPEVLAKLGGTVESKAGTSAEALTLLSYGYYQQFREAGYVPREFTDRLWGRGGATGKSLHDEAEEWAALVETSIFGRNDDAEVSMGLAGAVESEWDLGPDDEGPSIGGSAKISSATSYSKSTLEQSGSDGGGQLGKVGKERTWSYAGWGLGSLASWFSSSLGESLQGRGAQLPVGETERALNIDAELEYGPYSGEAELEIEVSRPLHFELSISAAGDLGNIDPSRLADNIVEYLTQLRTLVATLRSRGAASSASALVAIEAADAIEQLIGRYTEQRAALAGAIAAKLPEHELESSTTTKIGIAFEYEDGKGTGTLRISRVTTREVTRKVAGHEASAKIENDRQLLALTWPPPS